MNVIIIDDEKNARNSLAKMLQLFCPDVDVVGEADGIVNGKKLIETLQPDLVFLDIEMQDGTGLDLLQQISGRQQKVVFVTAYNNYAVEAFRLSAVDYLLKPIQPDHLVDAVNKVRESVNQEVQFSIFMENMNLLSNQERKIVLKDSESIYIIKIKDIMRCQADGGYTHFFIKGQKSIVTSINLKEYEKLFKPYGFIRSHHSHLVNIQHVVRYDKADGGLIIMSNQSKVPVSFRKKDNLMKSIQGISENPFL